MDEEEGKVSRLDRILEEIRNARSDLVRERERLVIERAELDQHIEAIEREMRILERLDGDTAPGRLDEDAGRTPLSRRVLDALRASEAELTFRQMREMLALDRREARNLGPVLNQLAKTGRIANDGRGSPWRLLR